MVSENASIGTKFVRAVFWPELWCCGANGFEQVVLESLEVGNLYPLYPLY